MTPQYIQWPISSLLFQTGRKKRVNDEEIIILQSAKEDTKEKTKGSEKEPIVMLESVDGKVKITYNWV